MAHASTGRPSFGLSGPSENDGIRQKFSRGLTSLFISLVVWVFALGTASRCLLFAEQVYNGGMAEFFSVQLGNLSFPAFGLHYEGEIGAAIAAGQALAVLIGLGLTLSPSVGMRRVGSTILVAWAGLWVAGAGSLAMEVPNAEIVVITAAAALVFLCTLSRGFRLWNAKKPKKKKG